MAALRDSAMMMRVLVNLYSALQIERFAEAEVELHEDASVADLLAKLRIPLQDVGIVMVNARSGTFRQRLKEGDRITLIPPVGGG
ncbi:MAG: MoaD/ThiS family protein [Thermodesulfobacteriota bacterium]